MKNIFFFILLFSITFTNCYYDNKDDLYQYNIIEGQGTPCEFTSISYKNDIVPILDLHCNNACHNATDRFGNVILETYNNVTPYVGDGSLIGTVKHAGGFPVMPTSGRKIPSCDIEKLQFWIDDGAKDN